MISSILMIVAIVCLIISSHYRFKSDRENYKNTIDYITKEFEKLNKSIDGLIIKLDSLIEKH